MPEPKYRQIFANSEPVELDPTGYPADIEALAPKTWQARISAALYRRLQWPILRTLQIVKPIAAIGGLIVVTREADVRAILEDTARFRVPFGPEMNAFAGGATFLLGLDGEAHDRQRALLHRIIDHERDLPMVSALSREFAEGLLNNGKGRIDAQKDLLVRVAAEVCCRYFGFAAHDVESFADWPIIGSNYLFADPFGSPRAKSLAADAAFGLSAMADAALARAKPSDDTLAGRLKNLMNQPDGPDPGECRAILVGLAIGFVPTNSLAGGKMLRLLSRNAKARREAIGAARREDADRMRAILLEAGRLDPALAPGQWRWCPDEVDFETSGGGRFTIPAQSLVLASTMAALRDRRAFKRAGQFDPDRSEDGGLLFGTLPHSCLGRELALAQIGPTIAALLRRDGIERSLTGMRMSFAGPYPHSALVTYDDKRADGRSRGRNQNGSLFLLPIPDCTEIAAVNDIVRDAMARHPWRQSLDDAEVVHFASVTAIPLTGAEAGVALVIEVNADGPSDNARLAIEAIEAPLMEILIALSMVTSGNENAWSIVSSHRVPIHSAPWGATGLQFYGIPDLSIEESAQQVELVDFATRAVDAFQQQELGRWTRASAVLRHVRSLIKQDPSVTGDPRWADLAREGQAFEAFLLKPEGARLNISDWVPEDAQDGLRKVRSSRLAKQVYLAFAVLAAIAAMALFTGLRIGQGKWFQVALASPWVIIESILYTGLAGGLLFLLLRKVLRRRENHDFVDRSYPDIAHLRALEKGEDLQGHVKNHITVVTTLKPGLFRRFMLAWALWGIGQLVTHMFRPGFVLTMGTIQFARWVRLPGSRNLLFQSNYDGSWQSYLEDFITRAHKGQTAVWSNCEGFPRSRDLVNEGAQDGDAFKNYVRCKQVPTAFWYSRFPAITADRLRRNALIHEGLCRATTESEARIWLSLFGSVPPTENEIDKGEVQSIVFDGFGQLPSAEFFVLRFSPDSQAREFIRALCGLPISRQPEEGLLKAALWDESTLKLDLRITFGEEARLLGAAALGLSASGLEAILGPDHPVLETLPGPFRSGMHQRAARLGDVGEEAPDRWRWSDGSDGAPARSSAILAVYSRDRADHHARVAAYLALTEQFGVAVVDRQEADPLEEGFPVDHFGFRDGVVQPLIAGTNKAALKTGSPDVVPAGEMIIGYRNVQGFTAPPIGIPAGFDPLTILPDVSSGHTFPNFSKREPDRFAGWRDFGRNGTMMSVRVLEQHPKAFEEACRNAARDLLASYSNLDPETRRRIDARWVGAKLIGRWQSGASLIAHADDPGTAGAEDYRLDFGRDDPQGLRCPLGSHVRRANPRDSLVPGDETELAIVNRHRIMRRGRNYTRSEGEERGLFFIGLCENLERQFEFVQTSWLKSGQFHTLDNEGDALVGRDRGTGQYSIPVAGGTLKARVDFGFTTLRAGGYFFVPGRSALVYLASHAT